MRISPFLVDELGFRKCDGDPCLYVKKDHGSEMMIIAIYVDDLVLAGNNIQTIQWMKKELSSRYEMKDVDEAQICVGLEISCERPSRGLFLSQTKYTKAILKRFSMEARRSVATPMEEAKAHEDRLEADSAKTGNKPAGNVPYRESLGV